MNPMSTFITHLTAQPKYSSVDSVLATALPSAVQQELRSKSGLLHGVLPTGTEDIRTNTWFTALPSDVKSYVASVAIEKARISAFENAASARSTTVGWLVVALAGGVGVAMILL